MIDDTRFHSSKNIEIPDNIKLLNIAPCNPELNPCGQIWKYSKDRDKNKSFNSLNDIKKWLQIFVESMDKQLIKSIVSNHNYLVSAVFPCIRSCI